MITNVTLSSTPQLITKQRANADKMRTAGVELEGDLRLAGLVVGWIRGRDRERAFQGRHELARTTGCPQVPRYNVGLDLRYSRDAWAASSSFG